MELGKKWSKLIYWTTIKPRLITLKSILPEAKIHPAGSRYVCEPPILGTDIDFLIYTVDSIDHILFHHKYKKSHISEYHVIDDDDLEFQAWRKGKVNLIVTSSLAYAESFHTATHICKKWNLKGKGDRVWVHEALRNNENPPSYWTCPHADLLSLLNSLTGTYGRAMQKAYRAKHQLEGFA